MLSDIKNWQPVQYIRFSCSPLRFPNAAEKLFETTDSAMLSDMYKELAACTLGSPFFRYFTATHRVGENIQIFLIKKKKHLSLGKFAPYNLLFG
jgi:hypothetical protein